MRRLNVSIIGLVIRGIGVGFMIAANLGANPATVFQQGFASSIHMTYGTGAAIANILILLAVYFYDKKYVHVSSLLAIILIGYSGNATVGLLSLLTISIGVRYVYLIMGCILIAIGTDFYIQADLGVGALDVIAEIWADRSSMQFKTMRLLLDGFFLVSGYLLGGVIGIGTVVSLLSTGFIIQSIRPKLQSTLSQYINQAD